MSEYLILEAAVCIGVEWRVHILIGSFVHVRVEVIALDHSMISDVRTERGPRHISSRKHEYKKTKEKRWKTTAKKSD